jgi:FixJ family two-component response regulator
MTNQLPPIVYVVEDDDANRKSLCDLLETYGCRTQGYATGEDFLAQANLDGDVGLILDVNLPGVSGLDVLERVRSLRTDAPAVVVSGRATNAMRMRAQHLRALALLEKPIEIDALIAAFESARRKS